MDSYRYFGVNLSDRVHWRTNSDAVYKKGISRFYFLRKLGLFSVRQEVGYLPVFGVTWIRLTGSSNLPLGLNVSVNGCHSV